MYVFSPDWTSPGKFALDTMYTFLYIYAHHVAGVLKGIDMKTNIDLNEELVREASRVTNIKVKKHLVEYALRQIIKTHRQKSLLNYYGKVKWDGDLNEMRKI